MFRRKVDSTGKRPGGAGRFVSSYYRTVITVSVAAAVWISGETVCAFEIVAPLDGLSSADISEVETGLPVLDDAIEILWKGGSRTDEGLLKLDRATAIFSRVSDEAASAYLRARVELYRGRYILSDNRKADARSHFETSMDLARQSLSLRESPEAYRVLADAGSSWMITKGLGGIIRMAPNVKEWSDRALELDSQNALALIIRAQGQINAPRSAGGNPDDAKRRLEELHERMNLTNVERFRARVSLSQAYNKLKDREASEAWLSRAKEIFPDNPMIQSAGR